MPAAQLLICESLIRCQNPTVAALGGGQAQLAEEGAS